MKDGGVFGCGNDRTWKPTSEGILIRAVSLYSISDEGSFYERTGTGLVYLRAFASISAVVVSD